MPCLRMKKMTVEERIQQYSAVFEQALADFWSQLPVIEPLKDAMAYSLFSGGKRIRPVLTLAVADMLQKDLSEVMPLAIAVELIHTYSLIHDDLPCMDNDDYRRGRLTSHKVYGEAMAVLAGDALLNLAHTVLLQYADSASRQRAAVYLSECAGALGMVGGQVADIREVGDADAEQIDYIHLHKTAKLFMGAGVSPAISLGIKEEEISLIEGFCKHLGLAFQITDDMLDCGNAAKQADKTTYLSVMSIEAVASLAKEYSVRAYDSLCALPYDTSFFKELLLYLLQRKK
ncbi:MAG: polyprenyl synthetase family protein [Clostridia bacterium]|nr:polyprenyl synthetase family protein [Clostridia bacterium]